MAIIAFDKIGIRAVYSCVPENKQPIQTLKNIFPTKEAADKFTKSTGVVARNVCSEDVCSSDLCYKAAKKLLEENNIDPNSIDVLIFLSQTSDYKMPATAPLLQARLGLPKKTACFDINLACSGYVYGLSVAFSFANSKGVNRVLLLCGETLSKLIGKEDFLSYPLFGDAGSATLVEKGDYKLSYFSLGTDGRGYDAIIIDDSNGGRSQISANSLAKEKQTDGVQRNKLQMRMDGMKVFSFTLSAIANNIKELLGQVDSDIEVAKSQTDFFLLHQANKLIVETIAKKLKLTPEKTPTNIERYGNTSSVSIPLLLTTNLQSENFSKNCVMAGFGAGLSWGSAYIPFYNCKIGKILTFSKETEE